MPESEGKPEKSLPSLLPTWRVCWNANIMLEGKYFTVNRRTRFWWQYLFFLHYQSGYWIVWPHIDGFPAKRLVSWHQGRQLCFNEWHRSGMMLHSWYLNPSSSRTSKDDGQWSNWNRNPPPTFTPRGSTTRAISTNKYIKRTLPWQRYFGHNYTNYLI